MNTKTKRRLFAVTGVIVIVLVIILAIVGSAGAAKTITVAEALEGNYTQRVQITGNVVSNSFYNEDDVLCFEIYDPDGDTSQTLAVEYEGAASSTFGNEVTAICTGTLDYSSDDVVLVVSELVTKCPSKYESSTDAISVSRLLGYGDELLDTTVKITGVVKEGTLTAAGSGEARFVLVDADDSTYEIDIEYDGALADAIVDGTAVVVTGSLNSSGSFTATDVAEEG